MQAMARVVCVSEIVPPMHFAHQVIRMQLFMTRTHYSIFLLTCSVHIVYAF